MFKIRKNNKILKTSKNAYINHYIINNKTKYLYY